MSRSIMLSLGSVVLVWATMSTCQAADKRPGAFIISPRAGASVGRTSEFTGKTFLRGQPLALVRAAEGNGHWWVQRSIQRNDRGQLKGTLQFGNDLAEPGTRFLFVVVVVQTPLELEFFTKRESMAEIPTTVPKSEIRQVVFGAPRDTNRRDDKRREDKPDADGQADDKGDDPAEKPANKPGKDPGDEPQTTPNTLPREPAPGSRPKPSGKEPAVEQPPHKKPTADPAESPGGPSGDAPPTGDKGKPGMLGLAILKPLPNAQVQRFEELIGRMESADSPVVLVRPEGDQGQWWVQDKAVFGEGKYFKAKLRFGNGTTPVGTRFLVLVVSPRPGPETRMLQPGAALDELPRDIRRSKTVLVQLGPPSAPTGVE